MVRASAVASSSGSYNSTAHAPTRIQFVKLAGACSGSLLSPARKLLRLSFAGSWFIKWYTVFRSLPSLRTARPSKVEAFCVSQLPYEVICCSRRVPCRGSQFSEFRISDKTLVDPNCAPCSVIQIPQSRERDLPQADRAHELISVSAAIV